MCSNYLHSINAHVIYLLLITVTGEYASAIETLVTAISLIKQSKVAQDDRCKILISSLQVRLVVFLSSVKRLVFSVCFIIFCKWMPLYFTSILISAFLSKR